MANGNRQTAAMLQRIRESMTGGTSVLMARPAIKLPAQKSGGSNNKIKVRQCSVEEDVLDMLFARTRGPDCRLRFVVLQRGWAQAIKKGARERPLFFGFVIKLRLIARA